MLLTKMYRGAVSLLCASRVHARGLRINANERCTPNEGASVNASIATSGNGYELENRGFLALERWVFLTDTDDLHRYEELPEELAYPVVTTSDGLNKNAIGVGVVDDAINEEHQGNRQLRLWLKLF